MKIIDFDLALDLYQCGFDEKTEWYWQYNPEINLKELRTGLPMYYADGCKTIYRPTYWSVCDWFRNKYKLHIYTDLMDNNKWKCVIRNFADLVDDYYKVTIGNLDSHDDALKSGVLRAVNYVK